ncbi:MAG: aspartate aminotransferase family protein [Oscillospiraceae bacterium]|nr:aspartate aminotransferase family protein [Oscillospiraceae bacterium]
MNFEEIRKADDELIMSTYGRFPVCITEGKGATAVDIDNKKYIDFGSGIGVNSLGYCDDGYVEAVCAQVKKLQHTSNLYYTQPQLEAAKKLIELSSMKKVLFCNSGAEANECAIKIARKYSFDKYKNDRNKIVTLQNSFHGRTVTTLAATGQDSFHNYFFPFTEGFAFAPANDLEKTMEVIDNKTCAVMIELVQGEGGVMPLDKEYVQKLVEYCSSFDILVVVDEVQTGVGRTGTFFGFQQFDIKPDIVTSAKGLGGGLPIGACIVSDKCSDVLAPGTHGTTFGANPVVCAGANYVLSQFKDTNLLSGICEKGKYIRSRLEIMPGVVETRGLGMMVGAVLENNDAKSVANKALENGLLVLTAKTVLRLLPPLNISMQELSDGLDILENTLKEIFQ